MSAIIAVGMFSWWAMSQKPNGTIASEPAAVPVAQTESQQSKPAPSIPVPPGEPAPVMSAPVDPPKIAAPATLDEWLARLTPPLAEKVRHRIRECEQVVAEAGYGHVVVGQVQSADGKPLEGVFSQMEILDEGCFVDAVASRDAPMGFWCPGYRTTWAYPRAAQPVEWLKSVMMQPLTQPGATLRAKVVEGLTAPPTADAVIEYQAWPLNVAAKESSILNERRLALLKQLQTHFPANIRYSGESGELVIAGLAAGRVHVEWKTPNARRGLEFELESETVYDLGELGLYGRAAAERSTGPKPERAPDGKSELDRLLKKVGATRLNKGRQSFAEYVAKHLETIGEFEVGPERRSVLVVGQIVGDGLSATDLVQVQAQSYIWPGGYFAFPVQVGYRVGFRLHGYDPLDYFPKGSEGLVEYIGTLTERCATNLTE